MLDFKITVTSNFQATGVVSNIYRKEGDNLKWLGTTPLIDETIPSSSTSITLLIIPICMIPPHHIVLPDNHTYLNTDLAPDVTETKNLLNNTVWQLKLSVQDYSIELTDTTNVEISENQT